MWLLLHFTGKSAKPSHHSSVPSCACPLTPSPHTSTKGFSWIFLGSWGTLFRLIWVNQHYASIPSQNAVAADWPWRRCFPGHLPVSRDVGSTLPDPPKWNQTAFFSSVTYPLASRILKFCLLMKTTFSQIFPRKLSLLLTCPHGTTYIHVSSTYMLSSQLD